jgi:hypothetical protein
MIEFEVFHDARNVKTKYTDAANPSDTAIGNVIFYNDADLYNAGDMGSVQGRVQGTCTLVSASPSYYCSFSYQIFNDDSTSVTFTAEGRVDNTDIKGSTLSISGGFNGLSVVIELCSGCSSYPRTLCSTIYSIDGGPLHRLDSMNKSCNHNSLVILHHQTLCLSLSQNHEPKEIFGL